ncbi:zinc-dependent peptidase [Pseudoalteromonas sp. B193]
MRVLVLNKPWPLYRNVKEILLYPSAYYAPQSTRDSAGLVSYHNTVRLGESWPGGTLVLSWHDVLEGNRLPSDGHNLVFHEFAHQLDQETGKTTGTPILKSSADYKEWGRVFSRAFTRLKVTLLIACRMLFTAMVRLTKLSFCCTHRNLPRKTRRASPIRS